MYFANPWGLLGLLSLPAITAIHLFQRRFPPLLVAGSHLWGVDVRIQAAGRRRDRLPITTSLLLELLAGLIFSLALAQPRFGEMGHVTHFVIVLDDSASMSSQPPGETSVRAVAIAEIERRMEEAERDSRVTLIRTGRQPTLLGSRAMTADDVRAAFIQWQPRSPQHDFSPAWDEAAQIVGREGRFLFLTDAIPDDSIGLPTGMDLVSLGEPLPNLSIAAARWTFDSRTNEGRLFLRIANHSGVETGVRVSAVQVESIDSVGRISNPSKPEPESAAGPRTDGKSVLRSGQSLFEQDFTVPANGSLPLETTLPGGIGRLHVSVSAPGDGLAVDDSVVLVEPKVRLLTVAVTLPQDSPELRLTRRVLEAIPDVQLGSPEQADLLIAPAGDLPASRRDLWWFGIGPINASPAIRQQARNLLGPYLIEKQHPLMEGIILGGVVWGGVQPLELDLQPLVSDGRMPLLGRLNGSEATAFLMNIDLARSNIGESPDWPILMTNLCELRRDDLPGLHRWNYRLNENIRFRAPPVVTSESEADGDTPTLTLTEPSGHTRTLVRDRNDVVEVTRLDQTGFYEVRDGQQVVGVFAVNFFDPEESDLRGLSAGRHESQVATESMQLAIDDPYSWLMVLAIATLLAAILADWYVLRPRERVR